MLTSDGIAIIKRSLLSTFQKTEAALVVVSLCSPY